MADEEAQDKKRPRAPKQHMNEDQKKGLVQGVIENHDLLYGCFDQRITNAAKNKKWAQIVDRVNSLGTEKFTKEIVKRRWEAIKSQVKRKGSAFIAERKLTGGGLGELPGLSTVEQLVWDFLKTKPESLVGIIPDGDSEEIEASQMAAEHSNDEVMDLSNSTENPQFPQIEDTCENKPDITEQERTQDTEPSGLDDEIVEAPGAAFVGNASARVKEKQDGHSASGTLTPVNTTSRPLKRKILHAIGPSSPQASIVDIERERLNIDKQKMEQEREKIEIMRQMVGQHEETNKILHHISQSLPQTYRATEEVADALRGATAIMQTIVERLPETIPPYRY